MFIFLILISCDFSTDNKQQENDLLKKATFDKNIIENIAKYQNLEIFLKKNIDTLIKFRYNKNIASINKDGEIESSIKIDDDCYFFFQDGGGYNDISNVPDYLTRELDSLFHSFKTTEIQGYEVCKNNKIKIVLKNEERDKNGYFISHELLWNTKVGKDYEFENYKDTLIDKDCIYRIGLTKHQH